jgi:hypothetical protein
LSLVGSITVNDLFWGGWKRRWRNQAVGFLKQEANKDPRWPVPFVVAKIETALDKAFRPVQLRAGTRIVAQLGEAHGSDDPIRGRGHCHIRAGNKAALAAIQSLDVIAAPVFKEAEQR